MRKKIGIIIFVLCISGSNLILEGQAKKNIEVGIKSGMNISKGSFSSSDYNLNYKLGYYLGLYLDFALKNNFSIDGELLYAAKGWNIPHDTDNENASVSLNYLEVPILVKYSFNERIKFIFGPGIGLKVSSQRSPESTWKDSFDDIAINVIGGAEYRISKNFGIEIRYSQGIKALYNGMDFDEYNIPIENSTLKQGYMHSFELGAKYAF